MRRLTPRGTNERQAKSVTLSPGRPRAPFKKFRPQPFITKEPVCFDTMAKKIVNDGRIGKEINWSLVIPSITRPVWEPPALEVLDRFEEFLEHADHQDSLNLNNPWLISEFPDVGLRCRYVDVVCEGVALSRHLKWAEETHTAAMTAGDQKKMAFYKGLVEALRFEESQLFDEHTSVWQLRVPRTRTMNVSAGGEDAHTSGNRGRKAPDDEKEERCDDEDEDALDCSSTTSYATAADDISIRSIDLVALIDLKPSSTTNTVI